MATRFTAEQQARMTQLREERAKIDAQIFELVNPSDEEIRGAQEANDDPWECREFLHDDSTWLAEQVYDNDVYLQEEAETPKQ